MAFLDNSGDIILDAVLTDAGRKRMAEGKFNIAKYAFGDEEVNYQLFNNNHPSGSAFYDLQIMQTPILEAFTNNTSTMSSKLMTLNDNNFLYLPVLKLNEVWGQPAHGGNAGADGANHSYSKPASQAAHSGLFVVTVDSNTEDLFKYTPEGAAPEFATDIALYPEGVILGSDNTSGMNGGFICVDQGIGGTQQGLSLGSDFPDELRETAYMIRIDNRLGRITKASSAPRSVGSDVGAALPLTALKSMAHTTRVDGSSGTHSLADISNETQSYAFVDDDNMATYYITTQQDGMLIPDIKSTFNTTSFPGSNLLSAGANGPTATAVWYGRQVFQDGPVGSRLMFSIRAQDTVANSFDLFGTSTKDLARAVPAAQANQAGTAIIADTSGPTAGKITVRYIDTTVSIVGVTTGYRIDIPVRFVKKSS